MSTPVCLRLSSEIYSALERRNREAGDKTITHTIRRVIADGLNNSNEYSRYTELIERLDRIESNTSVLKDVEIS